MYDFLKNNATLNSDIAARNVGDMDSNLDKLIPFRSYQPRSLPSDLQVIFGKVLYILQSNQITEAVKNTVTSKFEDTSKNYVIGSVYKVIMGCSRDPLFKGALLDNPRCAMSLLEQDLKMADTADTPMMLDKNGYLVCNHTGTSDVGNLLMLDKRLALKKEQLDMMKNMYGLKKVNVYHSLTKACSSSRPSQRTTDTTTASRWDGHW